MGEALIRASYSTNIKERRDCSTALFDMHGNTLCQAEHIPMHLGSFIGLIPHILKRHPMRGRCGRATCSCGNDAYEGGGTHLPDIVLAEPIFVDGQHRRLGGQPGASRRLRRSRPCAHLPGRPAHPADPAVSRRRAAARRAGADPAELPGAARAPVRPARADGGEPARRAAHAGAVREIRARHRARGRRRAAGLRRAQDARRHRCDPRRHLSLRRPLRLSGNRRRAAISPARSPSPATRCGCISMRRRRCAPGST